MSRLEEKLKFIFANVNDWLKFAEAKNGALLAINISLVVTVLDKVPKDLDLIPLGLVTFFVCGNILSAFSALASYLPHLKPPEKIYDWLIMSNSKNALYYGDLSRMQAADLFNILDASNPVNEYDKMIADQIICNAKIATKKYEFFTMALYFTVIACVIPLVCGGAYFIYKKFK